MRKSIPKTTAAVAVTICMWTVLSPCSLPAIAGPLVENGDPAENAVETETAGESFVGVEPQSTTPRGKTTEEGASSDVEGKRSSSGWRGRRSARVGLLSKPSGTASRVLLGMALIVGAVLMLWRLERNFQKCLALLGASEKTAGLAPRSLRGYDDGWEACLLEEDMEAGTSVRLWEKMQTLITTRRLVLLLAIAVVLVIIIAVTAGAKHASSSAAASANKVTITFDTNCPTRGWCFARELSTKHHNATSVTYATRDIHFYLPPALMARLNETGQAAHVLEGWAKVIEEAAYSRERLEHWDVNFSVELPRKKQDRKET